MINVITVLRGCCPIDAILFKLQDIFAHANVYYVKLLSLFLWLIVVVKSIEL